MSFSTKPHDLSATHAKPTNASQTVAPDSELPTVDRVAYDIELHGEQAIPRRRTLCRCRKECPDIPLRLLQHHLRDSVNHKQERDPNTTCGRRHSSE